MELSGDHSFRRIRLVKKGLPYDCRDISTAFVEKWTNLNMIFYS
jgi:hypothetical protein